MAEEKNDSADAAFALLDAEDAGLNGDEPEDKDVAAPRSAESYLPFGPPTPCILPPGG